MTKEEKQEIKTLRIRQIERSKERYCFLFDQGLYNLATHNFAEHIGMKMKVRFYKHKEIDGQKRAVFKVTLLRKGKQFTKTFVQSFAEGDSEPTFYEVLTLCLKQNIGRMYKLLGVDAINFLKDQKL